MPTGRWSAVYESENCRPPGQTCPAAAGLSTAAVTTRSLSALMAIAALTLLILAAGGVRPARAIGLVHNLLKLIFILFIIQCVFNRSGDPLLTVGSFSLLTTGGFHMAAMVSLRLLIILLSALLVMTGEPRDYLQALIQIKVPCEIAFMVLAALRFLPLLREEAADALSAVQMRGCRLKKQSLRKTASIYISILIPIVAGAIRRSEQMSIAMEARAFRAQPKRTTLRRLVMKKARLALSGHLLAAAGWYNDPHGRLIHANLSDRRTANR